MVGIGGDYISKALRETLDSVVSPEVRDRILRAALDAESLRDLPTSPRRFRRFLHGSLTDIVRDALGPELAEPVLTELSAIAAIAERDHVARTGSFPPDFADSVSRPVSGIVPRRDVDPDDCKTDPYLGGQLEALLQELKRHDYGDEPPSSRDYPLGTANALGVIGTASVERGGSNHLPLVLVATADLDLLRSFAAWLDPRASVQRVPNLLAMIGELREAGGRRVVLVIDARSPSVKPLALAALADDLPATTRVVLWGMTGENYAKMLRLSPVVSRWLLCGIDCPTSEIVAQCVRLVG
ncbi:MAG TPA: hypothetical protein VM686_06835 [Polyangiaceae bacterium]|jgi:hypothetical protein|nr:hypothetical protein [Polyangiaceae bacterium]